MGRVYPFCIASDEQYLYAAVFDNLQGDGSLFLLRSQAYPQDLLSTKWVKLAKSKFDHVHSWTTVNSCAAAGGAFLILFDQNDAGAPQLRGAFYDTNAPEKNEWVPVDSGFLRCGGPGSWCDSKLLGVPGSRPGRFKFFYRHEPTNEIRIASFNPTTATLGSPNSTLGAVSVAYSAQGVPSSQLLIDYLNPRELAVAMIDVVSGPEKNNTVNYRVFGVDDQGFPVSSIVKANTTNALPDSCRSNGVDTFQATGRSSNGALLYWCQKNTQSANDSNPIRNIVYSIGESPIRQVVALHEHALPSFLPVPSPNGTDASWAISYELNDAIYGFHLTGPSAGTMFTRDASFLSIESFLPGWSIILIVAVGLFAVLGLCWWVRLRHERKNRKPVLQPLSAWQRSAPETIVDVDASAVSLSVPPPAYTTGSQSSKSK